MTAFRQFAPLLIATVLLLALFRVFVPNLLSTGNLIDLTQQISVNAILAFGMTLVILIQGIDLSVGALLALVGTSAVYVLSLPAFAGSPVAGAVAGLACGLAVAAIFGAFSGGCAAATKMPPFIITLATMQVARGFAFRFNEGKPIAIPDEHTFILWLGNGRVMGLPVPVIIMLTLFVLVTVLLHYTLFGRQLYAMGGNPEVARLAGIPTARNTVIVFTLCSLLAGVAGVIHTSQLYSAEPASGAGFELNAIAAVVVGGASLSGGIGSMPGTLMGAIIIGILDKGLNQAGVHFSLQYVVKGVVILGAVMVDVLRRK